MRNRRPQVAALLALFVGVLARTPASAEPYLMVRAGAKCSDCHVNQTGGGKRTAFAHIHAHDILHDLQILPIPAGVKGFNPQLTPWASIGLDFRARNVTTLEDKPGPSGNVTGNRPFRHNVVSNTSEVTGALTYLQIDLWPEIATFYADLDLDNVTNREVFGLLRGVLPLDGYAKVGKFFPTFGLRVLDDEAFIRSRTGYTFENPDEGVELGFAPGPFFVATSITNGRADDTDVSATVNAYTLLEDVPIVRTVVAGASYARQSNKRWTSGFYAGANLWRFSYLGEFDVIDDRTVASETRRDQYAAYAELNFLAWSWLNIRGTFDFVKVANDRDQTRYAIGIEPFIDKFFQPRIQYRVNNGPRNPELNQDEFIVELRMFF